MMKNHRTDSQAASQLGSRKATAKRRMSRGQSSTKSRPLGTGLTQVSPINNNINQRDGKAASALQSYAKNLELDTTDPFEARNDNSNIMSISEMPAVTLSPAIHTKMQLADNLMETDFGMQTDINIKHHHHHHHGNIRNVTIDSQTKSQNELRGPH